MCSVDDWNRLPKTKYNLGIILDFLSTNGNYNSGLFMNDE